MLRYFNQDDDAGQQMTQALATLPPSQRASYARLQASIRASYHRSISARRTAEFRAHLSATQPGGSLLPHSRANPTTPEANKGWFYRGMLPSHVPIALQNVSTDLSALLGLGVQWECQALSHSSKHVRETSFSFVV